MNPPCRSLLKSLRGYMSSRLDPMLSERPPFEPGEFYRLLLPKRHRSQPVDTVSRLWRSTVPAARLDDTVQFQMDNEARPLNTRQDDLVIEFQEDYYCFLEEIRNTSVAITTLVEDGTPTTNGTAEVGTAGQKTSGKKTTSPSRLRM